MTGWQIVVALLLVLLLVTGLYVGFRFMAFQMDQRWPDRVRVEPIMPAAVVQPVPESAPPLAWWEELEALRSQFGSLQTKVLGHLTTAENQLRLARSSEERARKLRTAAGVDDDEVGPALPLVEVPGGWENAAPAPAARLSLLDQRRAR